MSVWTGIPSTCNLQPQVSLQKSTQENSTYHSLILVVCQDVNLHVHSDPGIWKHSYFPQFRHLPCHGVSSSIVATWLFWGVRRHVFKWAVNGETHHLCTSFHLFMFLIPKHSFFGKSHWPVRPDANCHAFSEAYLDWLNSPVPMIVVAIKISTVTSCKDFVIFLCLQ